MAANYHRVWIRFRKNETKRRLEALRKEVSEKVDKKISTSRLVEEIVVQFLDKESPLSGLLGESD